MSSYIQNQCQYTLSTEVYNKANNNLPKIFGIKRKNLVFICWIKDKTSFLPYMTDCILNQVKFLFVTLYFFMLCSNFERMCFLWCNIKINLHTFRGSFGGRTASVKNNGLKNDSLSLAGGSCTTNTSPLYSLNSERTYISTMKYTL